jgi:hypothetical protein
MLGRYTTPPIQLTKQSIPTAPPYVNTEIQEEWREFPPSPQRKEPTTNLISPVVGYHDATLHTRG